MTHLRTERDSGDLHFVTWKSEPGSASPARQAEACTEALEAYLEDAGAVLLHRRFYGSLECAPAVLEAASGGSPSRGMGPEYPPTFIEGVPCDGPGLAGMHAIAVVPREPSSWRPLRFAGRVCGLTVESENTEYLYLSDVGRGVAVDGSTGAAAETEEVFGLAKAILEDNDWRFEDVCRTWFYLRDILEWYDDFNRVRNDFFRGIGLFDGCGPAMIPASTGILGRNARGGWCALDLLAMRPHGTESLEADRLVNPRQNEAPEYGSAFARGLCVTAGGRRSVWVSGTASIDDGGASIHIGDFRRQTEVTLETIRSLLDQGGAGFEDIVQATAFVKNEGDVAEFHDILRRRGLEEMPVVCVLADVCRGELLFELDATAVVSVGRLEGSAPTP